MKIPWDNVWFQQFLVMLVLSFVGVYLPKDSVLGQLIRRLTTDWMGKNNPTPKTPTVDVKPPVDLGDSKPVDSGKNSSTP